MPIRVRCDVHSWMGVVVDLAGASRTTRSPPRTAHSRSPTFRPATYTLEAWHETLGNPAPRRSLVAASSTAQVTMPDDAKK
jgi:hypothetical protein